MKRRLQLTTGAPAILTFLIINAIFIAACVWLIILQPGWLVWAGFIAAWCAADVWLSRGIDLKWWHWALLITALLAIDLVALRILGQI